MAFVRPGGGKKLIGTAGHHSVFTDRKREDGGTDAGCTSGELLLIAMGSCATGSIRNSPAGRGLTENEICVDVTLVPPKRAGARDAILITVYVPQATLESAADAINAAAVAGGVCSRIALGSDVDVQCRPLQDFSPPQS